MLNDSTVQPLFYYQQLFTQILALVFGDTSMTTCNGNLEEMDLRNSKNCDDKGDVKLLRV